MSNAVVEHPARGSHVGAISWAVPLALVGCVLWGACGSETHPAAETVAGDEPVADVEAPTRPGAPRMSASGKDALGDPLEAGIVARFGTDRLAERRGVVRSLALSSDGRLVAIARAPPGWERPRAPASVCVNEVGRGALRFCRDDVDAKALAFDSSDGLWVVERRAEELRETVSRWPLAGGDATTVDGIDGAMELVPAPDGRSVLARGSGRVTLIDTQSRKVTWSVTPGADRVGFGPAGPLVVRSPELSTLDAASGEVRARVALDGTSEGDRAALSHDGRLVAIATDAAVNVFDTTSGARLASLPPIGDLSDMAFTRDGRFVAMRRSDPPPDDDLYAAPRPPTELSALRARFDAWDVTRWAPAAAPWLDSDPIADEVVAGPGGLLAWGGSAGRVHIAAGDGARAPELTRFEAVTVAGDGDRAVVLAFADGRPEVLDPRRGTRRALSLAAGMTPLGLELLVGDADSARVAGFVVADEAPRLAIWRTSDGALERSLSLPHALALRSDPATCRELAFSGADRLTLVDGERLIVLDATDGAIVARHAVPANQGCALADEGRRVVIVRDGAIEVVEPATGAVKVLSAGGAFAQSLSPSRRTILLATSGGLERWDVASGARLRIDAHVDPSLAQLGIMPLDAPGFVAASSGPISLADGRRPGAPAARRWLTLLVSRGDRYLVRADSFVIEVLALEVPEGR